MKYLKTYENINKPDIDEKTIRVEDPDKGWYIDFYFNKDDELIYVDNKWDINLPDWRYYAVNINSIRYWAEYYDKNAIVYKILEKETDKYNL
jgi:hypothetical protein